MTWPELIDFAFDAIQSAALLLAEETRDIFYSSAAGISVTGRKRTVALKEQRTDENACVSQSSERLP
jgi:hypothetical protein